MTSHPSSTPRTEALTASRGAAADAGPIRALLADIVDYAGLFPPARLDIHSAVRAYDRYRTSEHAWMLGAFVVPAPGLGELARAVERIGGSIPWPISVLAPSLDDGADVRVPEVLHVRAIEIGPVAPERIRASSGSVQLFYEVPLDDRVEVSLDAVARAGSAAKVRTGGIDARAFPTAERLARFIVGCAERGVPFKATAGLHHPVRGQYALTYERDSARCEMFGFLEVALVATLLWHRRIDTHEAAALLGGRAPDIELSSDALAWTGHRVSADEIAEVRRSFFRSFGSCSFEEPMTELTRLGFL
jgi:hypothetical protein